MSPKASSDFSLYKEKQRENNCKAIRYVLVILITVLFLLVIFYALVQFVGSASPENSLPIEQPAIKAEKLISSQTVKREVFQNAKPFGLTYRGEPPAEFTSASQTKYHPQFQPYIPKLYPHNIQDVIGYSRFNQPENVNQDFAIQISKNYKRSSRHFHRKPFNNFTNTEHDPFFLFKPQDPGEVNLLATSNFRFAPPFWSNSRRNIPKVYPRQFPENIKRHEVFNQAKPLTLTLNIYPKDENQYERYGFRKLLNHIENANPRIGSRPKKMVIRLNVYPDDLTNSESNKDERIYNPAPPSV